MRIQRQRAVGGACLALACAALSHLAPAAATDLAAPEFKPVTAAGIQAAIGVDAALASRRLASLTGDAAGLASTIVQQGTANTAHVAQSGRSNEVNVHQQGGANVVTANQENGLNRLDLAQQGNGNTASFSQAGGARASVIQAGDAHRADINQAANAPAIVIRQTGIGTVVQTTQF